MDLEKQILKGLNESLSSQLAIINTNMALMPEGETKEFLKESIKQANDRENPLDTKVFMDNLNKMTKNASTDNTK